MEPSELLTVAKDYSARVEAHLKEKAEWEAMHPGEMWDRVGFVGTSPIITECSHIDNVLDIASYLNIDYSLSHNQKSNDENINGTDIRAAVDVKVVLGLIVIAIIIAFSTICIILRIKKNSRKSIP
jgi:hypothetical protein